MSDSKVGLIGRIATMSIKAKVITGICVAVVGVAAIGVATVALKLGKVKHTEIKPEEIVINNEETIDGYTNIALFGGDSRSGDLEKDTHTDAIIVASIDNKTKDVRLISVYRDTFLDQTDGVLKKANNAYFVGGPKQAINMLNMNLDLDIKDYATVDFAAISKAIDLLGGIELEIKDVEVEPANECIEETARIINEKANYITKAGVQHLDGVQATSYARIRSTKGDDFTRAERQRLVIEKLVEKAKKADFATLNKIIDEVFPMVSTSMSTTDIIGLAKDVMSYNIVETAGFPFDVSTATLPKKGSVVIPTTLESNVIELHKRLFNKADYVPSDKVKSISQAIIAETGQKSGDSSDNNGLDDLGGSGNSNGSSNSSSGSGSGSKSYRNSGSSNKGSSNSGSSKKDNSTGIGLNKPAGEPDNSNKNNNTNNGGSSDKGNSDKNNNTNKPDNNKPSNKPNDKPDNNNSGGNNNGGNSNTGGDSGNNGGSEGGSNNGSGGNSGDNNSGDSKPTPESGQ